MRLILLIVTLAFLLTVIIGGGYVLREEIQTEIDAAVERFKSSNLHSIELLEKENEVYRNYIKQLEADSCVRFNIGDGRYSWNTADPKKIAEAIRFLNEGSVDKQLKKLQEYSCQLDRIQEQIKSTIQIFTESNL